jgi:hypothetical protein
MSQAHKPHDGLQGTSLGANHTSTDDLTPPFKCIVDLFVTPNLPHCGIDVQDVEGFEPDVMSTATQLLSAGAVENLIMEYTPGVLERAAR